MLTREDELRFKLSDELRVLAKQGRGLVRALEMDCYRDRHLVGAFVPKWLWRARCRIGWHDRYDGECVWCGPTLSE